VTICLHAKINQIHHRGRKRIFKFFSRKNSGGQPRAGRKIKNTFPPACSHFCREKIQQGLDNLPISPNSANNFTRQLLPVNMSATFSLNSLTGLPRI
jgi:hypothetical protein